MASGIDAVVVNTYGDKRLALVRTTIATLRRTVDWDRARLGIVDTAGSPAKREHLALFADVLECVDDPEFGEGAGWNVGVQFGSGYGPGRGHRHRHQYPRHYYYAPRYCAPVVVFPHHRVHHHPRHHHRHGRW